MAENVFTPDDSRISQAKARIYAVACWFDQGEMSLVCDKKTGSPWFGSKEIADEVLQDALKDPERPEALYALCVYEAKPIEWHLATPVSSKS